MPANLPPEAPALVMAAPGTDSDVPVAIKTIVCVDHPQLDVKLVHLGDPKASLAETLIDCAAKRPEGAPAAIVVPMVTGPHQQVYRAVREAVAESGVMTTIADPLGPHPLLAEALHVKLADGGLARADRMRLFNIAAPVDGIIIATVGGQEAVRAADATVVLLAARLTLPVVAASLDASPGVADAAQRLRNIGASRLALAPFLIGPEIDVQRITAAAASVGAGCAEALGAHSAVAQLVALSYGSSLTGVDPDTQ
ncbi:sirohydrochlorin chelatase [Sphaerisporangium aureirubrum]|uniref:Sirohydrochlorin chelatase n=1 Tax=Sphaerisporangium aureirubrum TaxID=1544736 RepID=A0ABW1NRY0_9ACTN